jgi:hypothetical protein
MKDETKSSTKGKRKPYVKPEIKQVPLTPEEAVLGMCKNTGYTGPLKSDCQTGGNCYAVGS